MSSHPPPLTSEQLESLNNLVTATRALSRWKAVVVGIVGVLSSLSALLFFLWGSVVSAVLTTKAAEKAMNELVDARLGEVVKLRSLQVRGLELLDASGKRIASLTESNGEARLSLG